VNALVATLLVKLTDPVGEMNARRTVLTVAVQLVPWLIATELGEHATANVTLLLFMLRASTSSVT